MLDIIHRYNAVVKAAGLQKSSGVKILDVGGGSESLQPYLFKKHDFTTADIHLEKRSGIKQVVASAAALPFKKKSYEVVISVDALEHMQMTARKKAFGEMQRVARKKVVVAVPCGKSAEKAEKLLRVLASLIGRRLPWLEEHAEQGLPAEKDIAQLAKNCRIIKNANTAWWLIANVLDLPSRPLQALLGKKIMMAFYGSFCSLFNFGKTYRVVIVCEIENDKSS